MRAVRIALQILEEVASRQPIGVSDLSRQMGLSKTTVQRALTTLAAAGWVEPARETRRSWMLSIHALAVSGRAVESGHGLRAIALPVMEEMRRTTGETIHLLAHNGGMVVLIERLDGIKPVRIFNPFGGRARLHRTSSGKAILARLPDAELAAYLSRPLTAARTLTPVDKTALRKELALVRKRGFAINLGENLADANAVGAAILDGTGYPIAAVTVSAPAERMTNQLAVRRGTLVKDAANRISTGMRLRD